MKVFWALAIFLAASSPCVAAESAPADYSDIFVVSVLPRSPDVQPIIMSVPAKEQPKQAASLKAAALDTKH